MKVVFLGASKGMGRELARCMAERGESIFLLGRNLSELKKTARDLEIRGASGEVACAECDLREPDGFYSALENADLALKKFDVVVVSAAILGGEQDALENSRELTAELLRVNFTNTILFCEEARRRLVERGGGKLVVFSSVAADRSRKPVILYGATKAGISYYLEGLDHKFYKQGLRTLLVKPGFVKTEMTATLPSPPFAGEARAVAERVLRSIDRGDSVVYAPMIWRWIMLVIRLMPRKIMRQIDF